MNGFGGPCDASFGHPVCSVSRGGLAFSETRADACILEVGLGGRLDATNVVEEPLVCSLAGQLAQPIAAASAAGGIGIAAWCRSMAIASAALSA